MSSLAELVFILVVVVDLFLLASSRLGAAIRIVAMQGALLGALPLLLIAEGHSVGHALVLAVGEAGSPAIDTPIGTPAPMSRPFGPVPCPGDPARMLNQSRTT